MALAALTMTEMCRILSSSSADSCWGSSVGSCPGRLGAPSWWWMWKSSVPFSSHCCLQRTRGMSSVFPEISRGQTPRAQVRIPTAPVQTLLFTFFLDMGTNQPVSPKDNNGFQLGLHQAYDCSKSQGKEKIPRERELSPTILCTII